MKDILIALLLAGPFFYSCTKTNTQTQAELNAAKLKTMIQGVRISDVVIWNGQQQTDTGGPVQVDDNGFIIIQSSVIYSLEDIKAFSLSGTSLWLYY